MTTARPNSLLDLDLLAELIDKHYKATGVPVGLFDVNGQNLISTGGTMLCEQFYRKSPETFRQCRNDKAELAKIIGDKEYYEYICPHGLRNVAMPIRLGNQIIGIIVFGRFLYDDDEINRSKHAAHARQYDFDKDEYFAAIREIPRFSRERIANIIDYYITITHIITNLAQKNRDLIEKNLIKEQYEATIREKERRYRLITENSDDVIWTLDTDMRIEYVSPAVSQILGYTQQEFIESALEDLIDSGNITDIRNSLNNIVTNPSSPRHQFPDIYEIKHIKKDGERIWCEVIIRGIFNERSELEGLLVISREIQIRKSIEQSLRNNLSFLQILIDTIPNPIFYKDANLNYTGCNSAFLEFTGLELKKIIGRSASDLFEKDLANIYNRADRELLERGGSQTYETRARRADGQLREVQYVKAAYSDNNNEKAGLVGILIDITEHKKILSDLRNSEERFKLLFEFAPDAYYMNDLKGVLLDGNRAAEKMIGAKRDQLIGKKMLDLDLLPKKYLPLAAANLARALLGMKTGPDEFELRCRDGRLIETEITTYPVKINNRTVVLGIARDITERKQAEKALRESEEKYRATVEQSAEGIYIMDIESRKIIETNPTLQDLLGYSSAELIGRPVYDIVGHQQSDVDWHIKKVIGERQMKIDERQYIRKNGEPVDVEVSGSIITYSGKTALLVVSRDITDRKQAEQEMKKLIEELRISNVTIEKNANELIELNEKLKDSEEKLKDLNERKDKFFSIIAHDLKSPFQGFLTLSKGLTMRADSLEKDEITEIADDMYESASNLFKLLENLLLWSRLQRRTIEIEPDYFMLNEIVDENIKLFGQAARNKNIGMVNKVSDSAFVYADMKMADTIIRNLMSNAIKFTREGGKITISANKKDSMIHIAVQDTGVGIEPERIEKLFKIGGKTSTFGTANEKGTGLGLALCRELVEKNLGTIMAESRPGKGTKFIFTLPAIISD
ncbi:MAG: PAS domain S-box protein [Candidatus Kapaibacterium sp.]